MRILKSCLLIVALGVTLSTMAAPNLGIVVANPAADIDCSTGTCISSVMNNLKPPKGTYVFLEIGSFDFDTPDKPGDPPHAGSSGDCTAPGATAYVSNFDYMAPQYTDGAGHYSPCVSFSQLKQAYHAADNHIVIWVDGSSILPSQEVASADLLINVVNGDSQIAGVAIESGFSDDGSTFYNELIGNTSPKSSKPSMDPSKLLFIYEGQYASTGLLDFYKQWKADNRSINNLILVDSLYDQWTYSSIGQHPVDPNYQQDIETHLTNFSSNAMFNSFPGAPVLFLLPATAQDTSWYESVDWITDAYIPNDSSLPEEVKNLNQANPNYNDKNNIVLQNTQLPGGAVAVDPMIGYVSVALDALIENQNAIPNLWGVALYNERPAYFQNTKKGYATLPNQITPGVFSAVLTKMPALQAAAAGH